MSAAPAVLGIDIAKASFAAALFLPAQNKFWQRDFPNTAAGHRRVQQWLALHNAASCPAGMEASGNFTLPLLRFLHAQGHPCSLLQPRYVKFHLQARGQSNKTDRQDAQGIAHFMNVHKLHQWFPPSAARRQMQELFQVLLALNQTGKAAPQEPSQRSA